MPKDKPGELSPQMLEVYEHLKKVRESKTVSLQPCPILREQIRGFSRQQEDFRLRYYQVQGIYHMLRLKRMVLGDGTGLGKTVEIIGVLAYLWATAKEAGNKVIVIAPKSAIYQWADEIKRFLVGVRPIIASAKATKDATSLQLRTRAYEEWANAPESERVVLIINYALLVRDWNEGGFQPTLPNGKPDPKQPVKPGLLDKVTAKVGDKLVTVFDECFDYYTPISLADGGTELIGKVVCGKMPVKVWSWNFERKQLEARQVTRWVRNPMVSGRRENLLKVAFNFSRSCRVTKSHKFYHVNGEKILARDIRVGSKTAHLNSTAPSPDQLQIVLGGLLGDASLSHPSRALWGVSFVQGEAQKDYLAFKQAALKSLGTSKETTTPSGYGGKAIHRFRLQANPSLCSHFHLHDGNRKRLTLEWLDAITPLGLAIWYGDDGSLQEHHCLDGTTTRRITLNTQGFTPDECSLLAGWLRWRWGVGAEVSPTSKGSVLYLTNEAAERFLGLLPGSFPGVQYKFPGKPLLTADRLDTTPRQELIEDTVTEIGPWKRAPKERESKEFVYDLEVEGNHNYFAGGTLVSNCTAFKSRRTKTWEIAHFLSTRAARVYGLTATLLKNRLFEGFCIYGVIRPGTFTTQSKFFDDYCFIELKKVGKARVPIVLGYKNLDGFRSVIDPFFLGRPKHVVSDELPTLTTREILCELSPAEDLKYQEALSGVLELGDGEIKEYTDHKALVSLNYCQQVVNSLAMLRFKEGDGVGEDYLYDPKRHKIGALGSKEQGLFDLLTGELEGEKVIVYTRFASLVSRLQGILRKEGIKSTRITGKESDEVRRGNQAQFQNLESDTNVIFITDAGSEAINLQAAIATVFYDAPWSWGNYVQTIGRMVRIGSPHKGVLVFHLIGILARAEAADQKTIDHHNLAILRKKKGLIDKVLGEAAVGALTFDTSGTDLRELVRLMQGKGSV